MLSQYEIPSKKAKCQTGFIMQSLICAFYDETQIHDVSRTCDRFSRRCSVVQMNIIRFSHVIEQNTRNTCIQSTISHHSSTVLCQYCIMHLHVECIWCSRVHLQCSPVHLHYRNYRTYVLLCTALFLHYLRRALVVDVRALKNQVPCTYLHYGNYRTNVLLCTALFLHYLRRALVVDVRALQNQVPCTCHEQ